ncbi:polysaccharide biosynthesis protein [Akkermansiaceae bacterium]|nr:polysaccharide biosynthesis protein [Akkermansiaceae bacterium]MDA7518639.1 polysaccharide biosynthesis protein [Akkermansiaceae bacterium]MDA7674806.1 polysaccharide biosynthesis protein [Akkermansiaceae bacterium]MDB4041083.1 polysaccharide biosynthesis protein [Akkermansiaceae bacterium]MDB4412241.1 polysaccharide biosynthesis protein [Akkermansiaceae bacterium]
MSQAYPNILSAVLGRQHSFLEEDIAANASKISDSVKDARILVIGAAGSIGGAFVRELADYHPAGLHLIDISENNLAEVVRDLRSSGKRLPDDFATYALDFGGPEMRALLGQVSYDYVLNFSALKHVRSERDPFTLMRLLDVNVLSNARLIQSLKETHIPRKIFAVSSDKAVRSANLMGASKAFMERLFLTHSEEISFGSARFANVAFSDGSLLHGFRQRIEKRQPISAPDDVRRYFISHHEAGQLCLLGCFAGENREIVYPEFRSDKDMLTFSEIAKVFLRESGYSPVECASEEEALSLAAQLTDSSREWPCFFSSSNTAGEKMYEEFVDPAEKTESGRFKTMGVITSPIDHGKDSVDKALQALKSLRSSGGWSLEQLVDVVAKAVPEMQHVQASKNLDQKM